MYILCTYLILAILNKASAKGNAAGADEFLPLLVYTTIIANPKNILKDIRFIRQFRNPDKLVTETAYYLTHLESASVFIENMTDDDLTKTDGYKYKQQLIILEYKYQAILETV